MRPVDRVPQRFWHGRQYAHPAPSRQLQQHGQCRIRFRERLAAVDDRVRIRIIRIDAERARQSRPIARLDRREPESFHAWRRSRPSASRRCRHRRTGSRHRRATCSSALIQDEQRDIRTIAGPVFTSVRCAISMKKAMPVPVPRMTMAPSTWKNLSRKYGVIASWSPQAWVGSVPVRVRCLRL